jgi:hypothetical protein
MRGVPDFSLIVYSLRMPNRVYINSWKGVGGVETPFKVNMRIYCETRKSVHASILSDPFSGSYP